MQPVNLVQTNFMNAATLGVPPMAVGGDEDSYRSGMSVQQE